MLTCSQTVIPSFELLSGTRHLPGQDRFFRRVQVPSMLQRLALWGHPPVPAANSNPAALDKLNGYVVLVSKDASSDNMLWLRQLLENPPLYGDNSSVNLSLPIAYPLPNICPPLENFGSYIPDSGSTVAGNTALGPHTPITSISTGSQPAQAFCKSVYTCAALWHNGDCTRSIALRLML